MKTIIFYEKPGCVTNAKQKRELREAGCMIIERNLLKHEMSDEQLYEFIKNKPVEEWFNPNAPKIKKGQINTFNISKKMALEMLMSEPILIKRPLMIIKDKKISGFNKEHVEDLLDIKLGAKVSTLCSSNNDSCRGDVLKKFKVS